MVERGVRLRGRRVTGSPSSPGRLRIRAGDERDRPELYCLRHAIYASELGQHPENDEGRLTDPVDDYNVYLVAERGDGIEGFISITPPPLETGRSEHPRYSIEKYVRRDDLPFPFDDGVFEIRLLTVPKSLRTPKVALLLMYAALRWVEAHDGTRIVAMGRRQLMTSYRRLGLDPLGIEVQSGAVTFELMHATTQSLRDHLSRYSGRLQRLAADVDWELDLPLAPPAGCYHGGAFFDSIGPRFDDLDRRHRVINADVLDAWYDPSPRVLEALVEHLPWLLRTSPPTECEGLVAAIAEARGVEPACILPGAGSSDLIYLAFRNWLTPESRALIVDPSYGEYAHVLEQMIGCRVDRLSLSRRENYDLDPNQLEWTLANGYDLVVLVNPNSPTGRYLPSREVERLLDSAPSSTWFWIDETYIEYVGAEHSLERLATRTKNLVVCKSMSKTYALSGARVGYLCGPSDLISEARAWNPPWAVSLPGQVAGVAALSDPEHYRRCHQETHRLRKALADRLQLTCGLDVIPGVANFLLCHLPPDGTDAAHLVRLCRHRGLFIRDASTMGSVLGRYAVRVAVKDQDTNHRMIEILSEQLRGGPES